jgi:hypothetical protein
MKHVRRPDPSVYRQSRAHVYIAMNGRIWDPARVKKNVVANRFEEA